MIRAEGIPSAVAFGTALLTFDWDIRPAGIASTEQFGSVLVDQISGSVISSAEIFGTPSVAAVLHAVGIVSAEYVSAPSGVRNAYIVLAGKKYMVGEGGYGPYLLKHGTETNTMDGTVDSHRADIHKIFAYMLKVRESVDDSSYGTIHDLQSLYEGNSYSSPIVMTDHNGFGHLVAFVGQLAPQPVSVIIEGVNSLYFYKVELHDLVEENA
jgi:hypothetical protein